VAKNQFLNIITIINSMATTTHHPATATGTPIKLPFELSRCGYILRQIHRTEQAAIYEVIDRPTGGTHGFEVFEIRIQAPRTLANGVHFAHKERYPANEDFGVWAFAPATRARAFEVFSRLESKARQRRERDSLICSI
jgi:hypothetical protein